jgi:hypothetical protein
MAAMTGERSAPGGLRRVHARLLVQADRLLGLTEEPAERLWQPVERVSAWSVGQHVEHLMLATRGVLDRLEELMAGQAPDAGGISLVGRVVLRLNYIPRGRARATTPLQPKSTSAEELRGGWLTVRRRLAELGPRLGEVQAARGTFRHLVFGGLDARQWVRFLEVHNHHHLKIVGDVQQALARPGGGGEGR